MNITLNNLSSPTGLITFTDIPNILKVEDNGYGTNAELSLTLTGDLGSVTTSDGQWYISFIGETISNVVSPQNAINKNFFISSGTTSTAASIARAFRNCPTISSSFNVSSTGATVNLEAKSVGPMFSVMQNYYSTNITSTYMTATAEEGSATSDLFGAKVDVDIYSNGDYITTLEKNYYGSEVAFNLSPVLTTFAEYGRCRPYNLVVYSLIKGNYTLLGNVTNNNISIGYMVNQGYRYLFDDFTVAMNVERGKSRDYVNNTILYIYQPSVPISFYAGNEGGITITIDYIDSAENVLSSETSTWHNTDSSKKLYDIELTLNQSFFNQSFYVDVSLGNEKVRFNVIKPIKATEYSQRVLWRNSYGGISFFDFTGQKTESRDLEISTYEKNIFDYYTDPVNELEKIYNNDVKYTVTLKSHLFENDGKYVFNDMLQSANVWTEINGENYAIIIDSITVDETDNNNIYEATVKYHYSQEPSLI